MNENLIEEVAYPQVQIWQMHFSSAVLAFFVSAEDGFGAEVDEAVAVVVPLLASGLEAGLVCILESILVYLAT